MKATGIVRRVDDLGRIVIPKEIRRTLRIREGDPLEIYTEKDGGVIFRKYSPMGDLQEFASQMCESVSAATGHITAIADRDGIIEMLYALDKIAPGTANDDTLLYGVEVKFYNMEVAVNEHLETKYPGLYIIGDGSGITHSLSHASASGVHVARRIAGFRE